MPINFIVFSILNAFRRKTILVIAIIGTGLGTALMTTLVSLSIGMDKQMNDTINLVANSINVSRGNSIMSSLSGGDPIPISYKEKIESLDNVTVVMPRVNTVIPKDSFDAGTPAGSFLVGVDIKIDETNDGPTAKIINGRSIEADNEIIVGSALVNSARIRGKKEVKIGDVIKVPLKQDTSLEFPTDEMIDPRSLDLSQEISDVETLDLVIAGIFETGNDFTDNFFVSTIEKSREISGLQADQVHSFEIQANDTQSVEALAKDVEILFRIAKIQVQVTIPKDVLGDMTEMLNIFDKFIWVISFVSAVAGGMSIFIITLMSVMERLKEFGIFKATGWSNRNIITSVIIESIAVALLGSLFGLIIGFTAGQFLDLYVSENISVIDLNLVIKVLLFGVVMGVLGGVIPAIKASSVSPIETLQSN